MSDDGVIGAFSEEQAERLSGVSVNQLRRWDAEEFFQPSYGATQKGLPYGRIYSFRDIVSLRVLNDLRNNNDIPLWHLREVSTILDHLGDAKWTGTTLYVLGRRVVFKNPRTGKREDINGQQVLDIPLRVVIASTRRAVQELNDRSDRIGQIVHTRFVAQDQPVLAGTRIPVSAIKDFAGAGYSAKQIINEYPDLTEADVAAALAYQPENAAA